MAVAVGDRVADEAATGVASLRTGAPVTPGTLFQIGSITKVWTGTLVMQLVDEGLLDLDKLVQAFLPEFLLADPDVASAVTVRQLLAHTGGFEGDVLDDFGRGDDAIEQYFAALASKAQVHPPGAMFSYCNAGFVVLGRLVERLREAPSNTVLRSRLIAPLGLEATATSADEAILRPAAVGHVPEPGGEEGKHMVAPVWSLGRAMDPAGAQLACAARDLAAFALVHLNDGKATDGTQVLSSESVAAMQQQQVATPGPAAAGSAGAVRAPPLRRRLRAREHPARAGRGRRRAADVGGPHRPSRRARPAGPPDTAAGGLRRRLAHHRRPPSPERRADD